MKIDIKTVREIDAIQDRAEKVYRAAKYYASQGIPILPIPAGQKHVNSTSIYDRFSNRDSRIDEWFHPISGTNKGWNIAIGCGGYYGGSDGVFAIDVDTKYKDKYEGQLWGIEAYNDLINRHGKIYGPVQRTPSGGLHILTKWSDNCTSSQNKLGLGVDTRGGYEGKISSHIMAWPSVFEGNQYMWESGGDVVECPPWIVQAMGVAWKSARTANGGSGRGNENVDEDAVEQIASLDRIQEALDAIDPTKVEYDEWIRIGQAIHSQYPDDTGLKMWDDWSARDTGRYHEDDCGPRWAKFDMGGPVRIGTLFYLAGVYGRQTAPKPMEDSPPEIRDMIDEYNSEYAVVLSGERAKIVRKEVDLDTHQVIYNTYAIEAFKALKNNDIIVVDDEATGKKKMIKKADIWMASPRRRTFDGIVMRPDMPPLIELRGLQYLNTWAGYTVEPVPGDWSLLENHIKRYLCRNNEEHYTWLLDWIADMFQEPANPKGCAVILGGKEGTGKGTLANALAKIFGIHGTVISNSSHLTSQYNNLIMDSVFLFADEVVYGGNHDAANRIKAMVSEEKNVREKKFGDQKQVRQFLHIMMASNNQWKIAAGPNSRRWFVLEVDDTMACDEVYFGAIKKQMNGGGYEAMLYAMLNRKITTNLRMAPVTDELKTQRALMASQSVFESFPAWIAHVATIGDLGCKESDQDTIDEDNSWPAVVSRQEIWEVYARWSKEYRPRATVMAINIFGTRMKEMGFDEGPRATVGGRRVNTYRVPKYEEFIKKANQMYAVIVN